MKELLFFSVDELCTPHFLASFALSEHPTSDKKSRFRLSLDCLFIQKRACNTHPFGRCIFFPGKKSSTLT